MKSLKLLIGVSFLSLLSLQVMAENYPKDSTAHNKTQKNLRAAGCDPAKTSTEFYVNNVRTLIHTGGDMWWDLQGDAVYEVPAKADKSGANALFAGSIWIGGLDGNDQLKLAAQQFRSSGVDYFPGPLITSGAEIASVSKEVCREYDNHYAMGKEMVDKFRAWFECQQSSDCDVTEKYPTYTIPDAILNWPAHGPAGGYSYYLAPFWDYNGDGYYNPYDGDFPYYEYPDEGITDDPDCIRPRDRVPKVYGDSTLWWVYNDKGNIHTETGGEAIGMEIQAQAFGFSTNDELNDMTFYNYHIINRSTYTLYDTYFGVWTDADLGGADDDYTGCDVKRGLGYVYNGDAIDDEGQGPYYGEQPPAIGIDFFEGPYQDADGIDNPTSYDTVNGVKEINCNKGNILNGNINGLNFGDGTVDNERWGMRRFLYFNRPPFGNGNTQDPSEATEYYNYLLGIWKDNSKMQYGGNGYHTGAVESDFMFPGKPTTDKCGWGQDGKVMPPWSEETAGNEVGDRRFVQSAGPFTLKPGAVNDITVGAVYARASSGDSWASVEAVQKADDKAQILFEDCFRVLNGPDAPELKIVELDQKLIFHIYNNERSNNYLEQYKEKDSRIICTGDLDPCDQYYRFQGYQVFQLKNDEASITDRHNQNLAREIFQCDVDDDVKQLVNFTWSDELGANIPKEMVYGADEGIKHSFVITKDQFAKGNNTLVNHRRYWFTAVAYGYNKTEPYDQQIQSSFNGLKKPYIAGRNNIKKYNAMPHIPDPADEGTIVQAEYGFGPEITQLDGYGNANNVLDLTEESVKTIMSGTPWTDDTPTYQNGKGPIDVRIVDPLNVKADSYTLKFENTESNLPLDPFIDPGFEWVLINSDNDTIRSNNAVELYEQEQLLVDLGLSVEVGQVHPAGFLGLNENNGFLEATMEFENPEKQWLGFVPDGDASDEFNWIRSGTFQAGDDESANFDDVPNYDEDENYEKVLGGTWGPGFLLSDFKYGPIYSRSQMKITKYTPLSSVDIVITPDKSKWTKCVVFEMCEDEWTTETLPSGIEEEVPAKPRVNPRSEGDALRFDLRDHPSVDKEGNVIDDTTHGMSWFPGYAIDVRTGERLNMAFGEDSWLKGENGDDMMWNPSENINALGSDGDNDATIPVFGGKHFIYVFGHTDWDVYDNLGYSVPAYDSCKTIYNQMMKYEEKGIDLYKKLPFASVMWASIPYKIPGYDLLETEVKIRLRVATPYSEKYASFADDTMPVNDYVGMYTFDTHDFEVITDDKPTAKSALDLIRVVPNPYYGHSYYENTQLDNQVRITNLPDKCTISIYNVSGRLIRRFKKDNESSYIDWDMKNAYNITIASGMYLVHIEAPGIGEKVVKWFGSLRPVDLQNF